MTSCWMGIELRCHLAMASSKPLISNRPASNYLDVCAYLAPDRFAQFRLRYGELVWGDCDFSNYGPVLQ